MVNFDYTKFDMFIIDSDNWQHQKDLFYGYKTVGDNGIWLKITNNGKELSITTSYIPPCYYLYEQDGYFAISNSYYILRAYLISKNIPLITSAHYTEVQLRLNNNFKPELYDDGTPTDEIKLVPIEHKLTIDHAGLHKEILSKEFATVDISDSEDIIDSWWYSYKEYFDNLFSNNVKINCELSGGFDSRLLYALWREYVPAKVIIKWHKEVDKKKNPYLDGIIGRALLTDAQKEKVVLPKLDKNKIDVGFNTLLLFSEGNFALTKEMQSQLTTEVVVDDITYEISGSGSNYIRRNNLHEVSFINGTLRRYFMQRALYNYYVKKALVIHPFYEYADLFKITNYKFDLMLIAYLKYCPELLEMPFAHGQLYHMFDENNIHTTNEVKELINYWKDKK